VALHKEAWVSENGLATQTSPNTARARRISI
jgi:hypothetical protein